MSVSWEEHLSSRLMCSQSFAWFSYKLRFFELSSKTVSYLSVWSLSWKLRFFELSPKTVPYLTFVWSFRHICPKCPSAWVAFLLRPTTTFVNLWPIYVIFIHGNNRYKSTTSYNRSRLRTKSQLQLLALSQIIEHVEYHQVSVVYRCRIIFPNGFFIVRLSFSRIQWQKWRIPGPLHLVKDFLPEIL